MDVLSVGSEKEWNSILCQLGRLGRLGRGGEARYSFSYRTEQRNVE